MAGCHEAAAQRCPGQLPLLDPSQAPSVPAAHAPVATQGGLAHTPRKPTTLGCRSEASMDASLPRVR